MTTVQDAKIVGRGGGSVRSKARTKLSLFRIPLQVSPIWLNGKYVLSYNMYTQRNLPQIQHCEFNIHEYPNQ